LHFLAEGPSSAGLTDEVYAMFLARDVRRVGPGGGDAAEEIQVHLVRSIRPTPGSASGEQAA